MTTPSHLYHYTRVAGLIGILNDRAMRATSIHCLNDSTEYLYAFQLVSRMLERRKDDYPGLAGAVEDALQTRLKTFPRQSRFVVCFSEEADSLSQWRSYAEQGGVNLAFEFAALQDVAHATGFRLERCLYSEAEQDAGISGVLDRVIAEWRGPLSKDPWPGRFVNTFLVRLRDDVASSLKHRSFAHEKEWRLVTPLSVPSAGDHLKFLVGGPLVVPYLIVELAKAGAIPLSGVKLGPVNADPLAKALIMDLLATHGCRTAASHVTASEVPYRRFGAS